MSLAAFSGAALSAGWVLAAESFGFGTVGTALIWAAAVVLAGGVAVWMLAPLWRRDAPAASRAAHDLTVYRAQLAEIDREVARGVINAEDAEAARREIGRKVLAADDALQRDGAIENAPLGVAVRARALVGAGLVLATVVVYFLGVGAPLAPDLPFAQRDVSAERAALRDQVLGQVDEVEQAAQAQLQSLIAESPNGLPAQADLDAVFRDRRLALRSLTLSRQDLQEAETLDAQIAEQRRRLAEAPEDLSRRRDLVAGLIANDRFQDAWRVMAEILEITGDAAPPEMHLNLGLAMVRASEHTVSAEAAAAFERHPQAAESRYFLGQAAAQQGAFDRALEIWGPLFVETTQRRRAEQLMCVIRRAARDAGEDPDALESALRQEVLSASVAAELPQVEAMVESLAARLESGPGAAEDWERLMVSQFVLGRRAEAVSVYQRARETFAQDPTALASLAQRAQSLPLFCEARG